MCLSTITQASLEVAFGAAIRNSFYFTALDSVRCRLQDAITEIACPYFGSFVAPLVGNQLGLFSAVPVTLFFGEMVTLAIKECAYSVYDLARRTFCNDEVKQEPPFFCEVALRLVSFAVGFFTKTYFYNYGMESVATVLRFAVTYGAPLCGLSVPITLLLSGFIILAVPTVTFIAGDILGIVVQETSYNLMRYSYSLLFDSSPA